MQDERIEAAARKARAAYLGHEEREWSEIDDGSRRAWRKVAIAVLGLDVTPSSTMAADEREQRARDLYERVAKKLGWLATPWDEQASTFKAQMRTTVDVIGEIERERSRGNVPLDVTTAAVQMAVMALAEPDAAERHKAVTEAIEMAWARGKEDGAPMLEADAFRGALRWLRAASPPEIMHEGGSIALVADRLTAGIFANAIERKAAEIERERHPMRVLTVAADGSQSVRTVPEGWQPLTEAEARAWEAYLWTHGRALHETARRAQIVDALREANCGDIPPEVRPLKPGEVRVTGMLDTEYGRLPILDIGPPAEHPRDHVEDEGTMLAYGTWRPDPLAPDPEDGTLCGGCRAPRNAIHSPFCPVRAGEAVGRVSAEMAATTGEPWSPKPGDRVRTVEKLTGSFAAVMPRRPNTTGSVQWIGDGSHAWIRHDADGSEAPYDADELRPEPVKVGTSYSTPEPAPEMFTMAQIQEAHRRTGIGDVVGPAIVDHLREIAKGGAS